MMMDNDSEFNDDDNFNDFEDDDFNEFDQPQKGSLSELWNSSPWPKIAVLILGVVTIIFGLSVLGNRDSDTPESLIAAAPDQRETPGQEVPEAYREAVEEVNQQRLLNALETGQSAIPIPVAGDEASPLTQVDDETPPQQAEDPLAQWRQRSAEPVVVEEATPTLPEVEPVVLEPTAPAPQYFQPDPEVVGNLAGAMSAQMQEIMDKHQTTALNHMEVTDFSFYRQQDTLESSDSTFSDDNSTNAFATETAVEAEILIPAGSILYAQTLNEANSDTPGPVLARILNGPMSGTRIIGSFQTEYDNLVITFNQIIIEGKSHRMNAVALDPETSIPGVATEVNRRYWRRVILPAAARFVEGLGQAIEEEGRTEVTVNNETVTSSNNDIDTRQELFSGVNEAAREFGDLLDDEADTLDALIRVDSGTMIGLLFTQEVIKPGTGPIHPSDDFELDPFTEAGIEPATTE